jgi:hypothetical protein
MSSDTAKDRFREAAGGRFPTASGISSARFWTPHDLTGISTQNPQGFTTKAVGESVPRPDRSLSTLRWLSIFPLTGLLGIDHFYLRSPSTGIAKLLTLGGVGLWYLWDMLQVGLEGDRVLDFGMSLPFDLKTGVGQGMVTDQPTKYTQETNFAGWALATVFGFLGIDLMMMGQFWKGMLKLLYFIFFIATLVPFVLDVTGQGVFAAVQNVTLTRLLLGLLMGFAAMGVGIIWANNLIYLLLDPGDIMTKGQPVPSTARDALGWWEMLYQNDIYCEQDKTTKEYKFKSDESSQNAEAEYIRLKQQLRFTLDGITGEEFRKRFWISHGADDTIPGGGAGVEPPTGMPLFKLWFRAMQNTWVMIDKYIITPIGDFITLLIKNATPAGAATSMISGAGGQLLQAAGNAAAGGLGAAISGAAQQAAGVAHQATSMSNAIAGAGRMGPSLAGAVLPGAGGLGAALSGAGGGLGAALSGAGLNQSGGARAEPMSTEAKIAAAVIAALASAGALKGLVDFLVTA